MTDEALNKWFCVYCGKRFKTIAEASTNACCGPIQRIGTQPIEVADIIAEAVTGRKRNYPQ
jgi:hypothetical protein